MLELVLEITAANDVADAKFAVHHRLLKVCVAPDGCWHCGPHVVMTVPP